MTTNEIRFLKSQTESEELWKADHDSAMRCTALEEKIKAGLSFFGLINGLDALWSRRVQAGRYKFDAKIARDLYAFYQWWLAPCEHVFEAIATMEKEGYQVTGAVELRKAFSTARQILRTNIDEVISGMEKLSEAA